MDTTTLIGITGAALILIAFTMNQLNRWDHESKLYDGVNFLGASILVYYAFLLASWPFLILNIVWALVSLRDLFRD